jgi:hypothetical protein
MPTSTATVATATPARYAKQLVSHLGHKLPVEQTADGHRLRFPAGEGVVRVGGDDLLTWRPWRRTPNPWPASRTSSAATSRGSVSGRS